MAFTSITLTGSYHHQDGSPATGLVVLVLSAALTDTSTQQTVPRQEVRLTLDGTGSFSTVVVANDDPTTQPVGSSYQVAEYIDGAQPRTYSVIVPHTAAGGTAALGSLSPASTTPSYAYAALTGATFSGPLQAPLVDQGGQVTNALAHGTTYTSATLNAALNAAPAGSVVLIPPGFWQLSAPLVLAKNVTLQGCGWSVPSIPPSGFGSSSWPTAVQGTVLQVTGTNDAVQIGSSTGPMGNLQLRDLFLLGPGSGTSSGVNINNASYSVNNMRWSNVGVGNFGTGVNFSGSIGTYETLIESLYIYGNSIGLNVGANVNDLKCKYLNAQYNGTAVTMSGGVLLSFASGTAEGNGTVFDLAPAVGATLALVLIERFWFEANTTSTIKLDTTNHAIVRVTIQGCQLGNGASGQAVDFAGTNNVYALRLGGNYGGTVVLPANCYNPWTENDNYFDTPLVDNSNASVTFDRNLGVKFGGQGNGKFGLFGATPAGQLSLPAKTAAATYGANEQTMLQAIYNALRTFGFGN